MRTRRLPEPSTHIPTLREAWGRFRVSHLERKGRSGATVRIYKDHLERLFADWLDWPLSKIGDEPRLLADRHDQISKDNGPAIANGAMRSFRAVYNHARKTCRALPAENPSLAIDWNAFRSDVAAASGRTGKALFQPIRVALTGRGHGRELDRLWPLITEGARILPSVVPSAE